MKNPFSFVANFEQALADYAGSEYCVCVESGTAAIFLSLLYRKYQGITNLKDITIPSRTYPSVPCSIINAGGTVQFVDYEWKGTYELAPLQITDGALRFKRDMYKGGLHCLSFHCKKLLPIGRGGAILTNNAEAYKWLKLARFDGREEEPLEDMKEPTVIGWNFYMTPEQAARGLMLFQTIKNKDLEDLDASAQGYPDLSKFKIYQK